MVIEVLIDDVWESANPYYYGSRDVAINRMKEEYSTTLNKFKEWRIVACDGTSIETFTLNNDEEMMQFKLGHT